MPKTNKDYRNLVITNFKQLIEQIELEADYNLTDNETASFRILSLNRVVKILEDMNKPLTTIEDVKNIKGIGKGSIKRIEEIIKIGKLEEIYLKKNDKKLSQIIDELTEVPDIGRKRAVQLIKDYKIKSIEDLKKKYKEGKVYIPDNIAKSLKYYGQVKKKIPHEVIREIETYLQNKLMKIDKQLYGRICGSYRRLKQYSNDLDFIVVHPEVKEKEDLENNPYFKKYLQLLKDDKFIIENKTSYDVLTKFMGLFRWNKESTYLRHIDIRFMPWNSYYSAILYFTGSGDFNAKMRNKAKQQGYTLNEYGLFYQDSGKKININSEKDIFEKIGMEYISPPNRK
jgi:DNA polymerase/3'-5' exonuclease PolX